MEIEPSRCSAHVPEAIRPILRRSNHFVVRRCDDFVRRNGYCSQLQL